MAGLVTGKIALELISKIGGKLFYVVIPVS